MRLRQRIYALCVTICLLAMLFGCASKNAPMQAAYRFLDALQTRDFEAAYSLLSRKAKSQIEEEEFCTKYQRIFDAMGLEDIRLEQEVLEEQEMITRFNYEAIYDTAIFGELSLEFSISLVQQSGWKVDWTPGLILPYMDWGDTLSVITLPPKRGEIFAGETIYAQNVPATTIYVSREKMRDVISLSHNLAPLISMAPEDISTKVEKIAGDVVLIKSFLPDELDGGIREQILQIPGVGIDYGNYATIRYYPQGSDLAHILGYCGAINEKELENARAKGHEYSPDAVIGKTGLELAYEEQLRGAPGKEYYVADRYGIKKRSVFVIPPQHGLDIHLTIKPSLQSRLEKVLELTLKQGQAGAVVVLNPDNGNIYAMSSYPTYDLNRFVRGISEVDYKALEADESGHPLFNRLTQGLYPPGSSIKPFTAAFALDTGAITTSTEFTGKIEKDYWTPERSDWHYPPIKRVQYNNRPSPLNLRNAMVTSDNIFFAYCAMQTSADVFMDKSASIGIGEAVPFDLPVARSRLLNQGTEINIKILADSGYGQGELVITPLQMATTFAALANNGTIYVPHVVESLYQTEGEHYAPVMQAEREEWKTDVVTTSTLRTLLPMLEDVVNEGTAVRLRLDGIAGKTGTAEITKSREISWFVGFTMEGNERRLVLVALEVATNEGGVIKLDIARAMFNAK